MQVEFYRGNIEGRGDSLEYYGAAAQIATRPVTRALIGPSLPSPASSPASSHVIFEGLVDTAAHKREAAILRRRQDNLQQQGWCASHWAGWK